MAVNFFSFIVCCFFSVSAYTQSYNYNTSVRVKMDGYIINLGGEMLFQPCEDSSTNIWEAMDNRSFSIWCNQINTQYCDAIAHIGDSLLVKWCVPEESSRLSDIQFSYFYCSLDIDMQFLSTSENDFYVYKKPQYEILYNQKKYPLKGFYIREYIRKLIPHKREHLLLMYKYYVDKGYTVPEWLAELVEPKKSQ